MKNPVYWWMSYGLKQILNKASEREKGSIYKLVEDYFSFYKKIKKSHGSLSAAVSTHKNIDRMFQEHVDASDYNKKLNSQVACKKGCYYCCLQAVFITTEEGELIRQYCRENKITIDKKKMMRQRKADDKEWRKLPRNKMRCVFLNDSNECSIYPVRPANCRKYRVLYDSEQCNPYKNPNGQVPVFTTPTVESVVTATLTATEFCGTIPQVMLKVLRKG